MGLIPVRIACLMYIKIMLMMVLVVHGDGVGGDNCDDQLGSMCS
jgi:hypothetical protein